MRHRRKVTKLSRTESHRKALLRNLTSQLFTHERITTTDSRAKAIRPLAERMITIAKRDTVHARRLVSKTISDRSVVRKLFTDLSPRFREIAGGYTRIMKLANRPGDNARLSIIELIEGSPSGPARSNKSEKAASDREKKTTRGAGEGKKGVRKRLSRKGRDKPKEEQ